MLDKFISLYNSYEAESAKVRVIGSPPHAAFMWAAEQIQEHGTLNGAIIGTCDKVLGYNIENHKFETPFPFTDDWAIYPVLPGIKMTQKTIEWLAVVEEWNTKNQFANLGILANCQNLSALFDWFSGFQVLAKKLDSAADNIWPDETELYQETYNDLD